MTPNEPDPVPESDPEQPLRGARWAHEVIERRSVHDRAERSGEPESAIRADDPPVEKDASD
jgi:hypothetical protein